jgi:hypothetical protein
MISGWTPPRVSRTPSKPNSPGHRSLRSNLSKSPFPRYLPFDGSGRKSFNKDDGEVEAGVGRERKREKRRRRRV